MPANTPVTTPLPVPIVAMVILPLAQLPPAVASVSAVVSPAHTFVVPVIDAGKGLTVTGVVMIQPVANV